MGQIESKPQPGTELRVIGAGLSRTGTASFSLALEILLQGPVYHGGTQVTTNKTAIKTWIELFSATPIRDAGARARVVAGLQSQLDGFAAVTDTPANLFVPELLQCYPNAIVICTVRDRAKWEKSIDAASAPAKTIGLGLLLAPLPVMRHLIPFLWTMRRSRWQELYFQDSNEGATRPVWQVWDEHMRYLEALVPADRLFYFDVKDGWEPLCKILHCKVPDVPFPHVNDGAAMEAWVKQQIGTAVLVWACILAVLAAAGTYIGAHLVR